MKFYTIKRTNIRTKEVGIAEIDISSNENAEFCNSYSAEIDFSTNPTVPWMTSEDRVVQSMINGDSPKWYNSGQSSPQFKMDKRIYSYEIVEIEF